MIKLLRRSNRSLRPQFHRPLVLESLQQRIVPAAATLTEVNARVIGSTLIVTGQVEDDSSGVDTVTLNFGGAVGQGLPGSPGGGATLTATTNASGQFEFIVTNYNHTGTISLSVTDDEAITSATQEYMPATGLNMAPYVTFVIQYNADQTVTFSGMVYDESPASATVTITGLASPVSLTPNSNGTFSYTVAYDEPREVSCQAKDDQDQLSIARDALLNFQPPTFADLDCGCIGHNTYQITGRVNGTFVAGMLITLDAPECPTLDGQVIIVQADGSFSLTVLLSNDPLEDFGGTITLTIHDHWNNTEHNGEVFLLR